MNKIVAFVEVLIPITQCNLKCHYCYVMQRHNRTNAKPILPEAGKIREALRKERFGGRLYVSLCGAGETTLTPDLMNIVLELLKEGHFVNVTTNGTVTKFFKQFEEYAKQYPELMNRLNFSFSLHYLEMQRTKSYEKFWKNIETVKYGGASFVVQINLCDEYEEYLDVIKSDCLQHVGAMPQVAATRDEVGKKNKGVSLYTKHDREEYIKVGKMMESPLFDYTMKNFMVKRKEFCYAGRLSYVLNLSTGILKPCYCSFDYQNIYKDLNSPIKLYPVGHYCQSPFCMNSSHFISLGVIPELKNGPTYAELRNRTTIDGGKWYQKEFEEMASQKICDNVSLTLTLNDKLHIHYYGAKSYVVRLASNILPSKLVKNIKDVIRRR